MSLVGGLDAFETGSSVQSVYDLIAVSDRERVRFRLVLFLFKAVFLVPSNCWLIPCLLVALPLLWSLLLLVRFLELQWELRRNDGHLSQVRRLFT